MSNSSETSETSPEPTSPAGSTSGSGTLDPWQKHVQENACNMLIADSAVRMCFQERVMRNVDRLARKMQDGTLGEKTEDPPEDPMEVKVGTQETVHHHHAAAASEPANVKGNDSDQTKNSPLKSGVLGPLALGAALVIGLLAGVWGGDLFDREPENGENVGAPPVPTVQPAAEQWLRITVEEPDSS